MHYVTLSQPCGIDDNTVASQLKLACLSCYIVSHDEDNSSRATTLAITEISAGTSSSSTTVSAENSPSVTNENKEPTTSMLTRAYVINCTACSSSFADHATSTSSAIRASPNSQQGQGQLTKHIEIAYFCIFYLFVCSCICTVFVHIMFSYNLFVTCNRFPGIIIIII